MNKERVYELCSTLPYLARGNELRFSTGNKEGSVIGGKRMGRKYEGRV